MVGLLNSTTSTIYTFTLPQLWGWILGIAGGITCISGAVAVIIKMVNRAKEPDKKQNEKLDAHEKEFETINRKLEADKEVLEIYKSRILSLEEHQKEQDIILEEHSHKVALTEKRLEKNDHGLAVVMQALLALLSHSLDGNAVEPMQKAKAALEDYLING